MSWLYGQTWLWYLIAFAVGVLLAWLLLVRPQQRRLLAGGDLVGAGSRTGGRDTAGPDPAGPSNGRKVAAGTAGTVGAGSLFVAGHDTRTTVAADGKPDVAAETDGEPRVAAAAEPEHAEPAVAEHTEPAVAEHAEPAVPEPVAAAPPTEPGGSRVDGPEPTTERLPAVDPGTDTSGIPARSVDADSSTSEIPVVPEQAAVAGAGSASGGAVTSTEPGKAGKAGKAGKSGKPGKDGRPGKDGKPGRSGESGRPREPGESSRVPGEPDEPAVPAEQGLLAGAPASSYAAGPFPGSALPGPDGSAPGPEFTIKGNADSMLFHSPDSPHYERTKAEVWFSTTEEAEEAGFTSWTRKKR